MKSEVLALILGGGSGTRLLPLTLLRSKPAVPLAGKYRLIDITVSNCINSGIQEIFVLTQFNSASLNNHIARTYRFSPFSDGFVDVLAAEQTPGNRDWFQGTADAVRQVLMHVRNLEPRNFLILSGDHLYRMDYRELLAHHLETRADLTVSVIPVDEETATGCGLMRTDEHGRLIEFREKPSGEALHSMRVDTGRFGLTQQEAHRRPYLASMGIYVFRFETLCRLIEGTDYNDFGHQVLPAAIETNAVQSFVFDDYWEDIGTIKAFYDANLALTDRVPRFNFFDTRSPIYTHARFLPASKYLGCSIADSIISDGSIINRSDITHSIIGIRSRIQDGSRITDSMIMGADYYQTIEELEADRACGIPRVGIGEGAIIEGAIIDKNARIGAGVHIRNAAGRDPIETENYHIRDGIVVIPKGAIIPDGAVI
ncbi:MAG: glucose-1-phosphate adenylyltransferase [Acidobacteriota bacterium]|nr:MAG: glucose-1-phosphate adenylyltransferase [Acidobacteriota bacterium]